VVFDGHDAGIGIAEVHESRVTRARRLFGTIPQMAAALAADGYSSAPVYLDLWSDERRAILQDIWPGASLEPRSCTRRRS
jgi:hypothetical protein